MAIPEGTPHKTPFSSKSDDLGEEIKLKNSSNEKVKVLIEQGNKLLNEIIKKTEFHERMGVAPARFSHQTSSVLDANLKATLETLDKAVALLPSGQSKTKIVKQLLALKNKVAGRSSFSSEVPPSILLQQHAKEAKGLLEEIKTLLEEDEELPASTEEIEPPPPPPEEEESAPPFPGEESSEYSLPPSPSDSPSSSLSSSSLDSSLEVEDEKKEKAATSSTDSLGRSFSDTLYTRDRRLEELQKKFDAFSDLSTNIRKLEHWEKELEAAKEELRKQPRFGFGETSRQKASLQQKIKELQHQIETTKAQFHANPKERAAQIKKSIDELKKIDKELDNSCNASFKKEISSEASGRFLKSYMQKKLRIAEHLALLDAERLALSAQITVALGKPITLSPIHFSVSTILAEAQRIVLSNLQKMIITQIKGKSSEEDLSAIDRAARVKDPKLQQIVDGYLNKLALRLREAFDRLDSLNPKGILEPTGKEALIKQIIAEEKIKVETRIKQFEP